MAAAAALAGLVALAACGDSTGPEGAANVSVAFRPADEGSASAAAAARSPRLSITAEGGNGTLTIDRAHLVMEEFELERREGACESDDGSEAENDECEEFEAGPRFVELPLEGGSTVAVTQQVPSGTFVGLEFEVDDVEADDDGDDGESLQSFLQQIRDEFPEWPEKASLRVEGSFTPSGGGEARPFVAYIEAEIEIEKRFDSPLTVEEGTDRTVSVAVAPDVWFTRPDGTVVDLSRFDHEETGRVAELEIEMENGFTETEFDGEDD